MDPAHGWAKVKAGYALAILLQDMHEKQIQAGVDSRAPPLHNGMKLKTFNEWLTKQVGGLEELGSSDGCITKEQDEAVLLNQLEQLVDRVAGVLHYASAPRREALVEKFINDVRNRM